MATSLRTKRRIFDLNRIILSMLNKASNFDHEYISFSPTQYFVRSDYTSRKDPHESQCISSCQICSFKRKAFLFQYFTWKLQRKPREFINLVESTSPTKKAFCPATGKGSQLPRDVNISIDLLSMSVTFQFEANLMPLPQNPISYHSSAREHHTKPCNL